MFAFLHWLNLWNLLNWFFNHGNHHAVLKIKQTIKVLHSMYPLLKCQILFTRIWEQTLLGTVKFNGSQWVWRYCPMGITLTNKRTCFVIVSSVMAGFGTSLLIDRTQKKILTSNVLLHLYYLNLDSRHCI